MKPFTMIQGNSQDPSAHMESAGTYELWVGETQTSLFRVEDYFVGGEPTDAYFLVTHEVGNTSSDDKAMTLAWRFWADSFWTAKYLTWLMFPACKKTPVQGKLRATYEELMALLRFISPEHPKHKELLDLWKGTSNKLGPQWDGKRISISYSAKDLGITFGGEKDSTREK